MVTGQGRQMAGDAHGVQDLGVPRVPGSRDVGVQDAGPDWHFSLAALQLHNVHVSGGRSWSGECGVCEEGLEGILAAVEEERPKKPGVAEGGGADEEEATAPARGDGTGRWAD